VNRNIAYLCRDRNSNPDSFILRGEFLAIKLLRKNRNNLIIYLVFSLEKKKTSTIGGNFDGDQILQSEFNMSG
jgi:hypothetical protein